MKEDPTLIDTLFKRVTEFSMTYIELIKLKNLDRASEIISSIFPDFIVSTLILTFLLFINLGLAFWLGDVLGKVYWGFLLVAGFYFVLGLVFHFFMRGWVKKTASNYFVKQFFKQTQ
jgi:hypothetical protein